MMALDPLIGPRGSRTGARVLILTFTHELCHPCSEPNRVLLGPRVNQAISQTQVNPDGGSSSHVLMLGMVSVSENALLDL